MAAEERSTEQDPPPVAVIAALGIAAVMFLLAVSPVSDERLRLVFPVVNDNAGPARIAEAIRFLGYGIAGLLALVAAVSAGGRRPAIAAVIVCLIATEGWANVVVYVPWIVRSLLDVVGFVQLRLIAPYLAKNLTHLAQTIPIDVLVLFVGRRVVRPLGVWARVALCGCAVFCVVNPRVFEVNPGDAIRVLFLRLPLDSTYGASALLAQMLRQTAMCAVVPLFFTERPVRRYALALVVFLFATIFYDRFSDGLYEFGTWWWLYGYFAGKEVLATALFFALGWLLAVTPTPSSVRQQVDADGGLPR